MSDFDDLFADVSFPDMTINTDGSVEVDGETTGQIGQGDEGSQAAAAGDKSGQAGDSQTGKEGGKDADSSAADDTGKKDTGDEKGNAGKEGYDEDGKPLPFDQHPKWKSARAAEKRLNELLEEKGYLSLDELVEELETGKGLAQKLKGRDVDEILEAADKFRDAQSRYTREQDNKRYENETPDERVTRLEKANSDLQAELSRVKTQHQELMDSQEAIENYGNEVDRVLDSLEDPFSDNERAMARLLMGVDNPANMIDIEDRMAVRKMAKSAAGTFSRFIQGVKQAAIDEYTQGKSKLTTTSRAADAGDVGGGQKKPSKAADPNASIDDVFGEAQEEFAEVLLKGLEAAH